jgi:hypothetical protein
VTVENRLTSFHLLGNILRELTWVMIYVTVTVSNELLGTMGEDCEVAAVHVP